MGAQWGWHIDQEDQAAMPLGERIRELRKTGRVVPGRAGRKDRRGRRSCQQLRGRPDHAFGRRPGPPRRGVERFASTTCSWTVSPAGPCTRARTCSGTASRPSANSATTTEKVLSLIDALVTKNRLKALVGAVS